MSTNHRAQGNSLPKAILAEGADTVQPALKRSSYVVVWLAALAVGLGVWLATAAAVFHVEPEVEKIALVMGGEVIGQSQRTREIAARCGRGAFWRPSEGSWAWGWGWPVAGPGGRGDAPWSPAYSEA